MFNSEPKISNGLENVSSERPSVLKWIREHSGLGIVMTASLVMFLEACDTNRPSKEILKDLENNPAIEKIGPEEISQIKNIIDLAKEKKTENLYTVDNDSLRQTIDVDTVANSVKFKTTQKSLDKDRPDNSTMVNKYYQLGGGEFNFDQRTSVNSKPPTISLLNADTETGIVKFGRIDGNLDPKGPNNSVQEYMVKTSGEIDGDKEVVEKLKISYIQGLKDIQILTMNVEK